MSIQFFPAKHVLTIIADIVHLTCTKSLNGGLPLNLFLHTFWVYFPEHPRAILSLLQVYLLISQLLAVLDSSQRCKPWVGVNYFTFLNKHDVASTLNTLK
jgi:hypothetical protein